MHTQNVYALHCANFLQHCLEHNKAASMRLILDAQFTILLYAQKHADTLCCSHFLVQCTKESA